MTEPIILILDLDGVLITNPPWKPDEIDSDGYSKFNQNYIDNLNKLLDQHHFEIWLSSTRRTVKTLSEFNLIFKHRGINSQIEGFLPEYDVKSRREEIEKFIEEKGVDRFLILDDDKSLNGAEGKIKSYSIITELMKGFDDIKLKQALDVNWQ